MVKNGGDSIMVWGWLTWNGPGQLHCVEGTMDRFKYCSILEQFLLGTLSDYNISPSSIIFVHDRDPKHKVAFTQGWLCNHKICVLPWAPSSPDMNIIEHAWDYVDRRIHAQVPLPSNTKQLWDALTEEWGKLDKYFVRRLYCSIPSRVQALKKAKGGYTKY